ncbi:squalene/phytoene synthase family protein [Chitinivibrio alkaliphilus]|uniref:Squalene synthase n=1 Tax=Chitinivibrio alkaliphilus ACht1 TaxID=1313304 RepID=U7D8X5_9BACT|nr:squalene/phytoene synthase family protein [Chitinivibrio alkaliphilus]ERP30845.1 squalene synthase [Chitinivibrio alkaliphilus ACht1]
MKIERQLDRFKKSLVEGRSINEKIFCRVILHKVSRTYALTIRSLGQPFREPVLIGYLICRIADTYEDTVYLSVEKKLEALQLYKELFQYPEKRERNQKALFEITHNAFSLADNEEFLATYISPVITRFSILPKDVQQIMTDTVVEMISGMKDTVRTQDERGTVGTETEEELDAYCYYVAGTVGNMLTRLFQYYSPWIQQDVYERMRGYNSDFGRALQLTNIIKDAMGDLSRGVSFIPRDLARRYNISLHEIHLTENRDTAFKIMEKLIQKALRDLNRAMEYSILIPKGEPRIRIFCMMPVLFAIKTLAAAVQSDDLFNPDRKVKISREEVKRTIRFLFLNCLWDYRVVKEYLGVLSGIEAQLGIAIPHNFRFEKTIPMVHIDHDK